MSVAPHSIAENDAQFLPSKTAVNRPETSDTTASTSNDVAGESSSPTQTLSPPPALKRARSSSADRFALLVNGNSSTNTKFKAQTQQIKLVALINEKSGGFEGPEVLKYFQTCGIPAFSLQCFADEDSEKHLQKLTQLLQSGPCESLRVVIGGGDGSFTWAYSVLDRCEVPVPPIVPLPLGSGNDLSRSLGWGNTLAGLDLAAYLRHLQEPHEEHVVGSLDRWSVQFADKVEDKNQPRRLHSFCAYLSIGWDADICAEHAHLRATNPDHFKSRLANIWFYWRKGAQNIFKQSKCINDSVRLKIDGESVELPPNTRSLKLININSAANGINFFGFDEAKNSDTSQWQKPCAGDKALEICSTTGLWQIVPIHLGLTTAHRLGQSHRIEIEMLSPANVQMDGESWLQKECTLEITHKQTVPFVLGPKDCKTTHGVKNIDERCRFPPQHKPDDP